MSPSTNPTQLERPEAQAEVFPGPAFKAYWAALGASQMGSAVSLVTIPIIAAVTLGAQPTQMAWLVAMGMLPSLLVRVPAAILGDAFRNRLPVLIICNVVQAVLVGLVPLLWWLDVLSFPVLLALEGAASLLLGVYHSLASPILPQIVPKDRLVDANGKMSATRSVADIGGPALASGLLAILTAPLVVLADSVSFLASAVLLTRVKVSGDEQERSLDEPSMGATGAWQGRLRTVGRIAAALTRRSGVQVLIAIGLVSGVVEPVLVLFMLHDLRLHPSTVAVLLALGAIGGIVGGLAVGRILTRHGSGKTLAIGVLATVASLVLLPFGHPGMSGAAGVVLLEVAGSFGGTLVIATVFGGLQGSASSDTVARVMALASTQLQLANLLGAVVGGVLGTVLGVRPTLVIGATLMAATLLPQVARWAWLRWDIDAKQLPS